MRKIYITKEDLLNELETARDKLFKDKSKPAGPFAYIAVVLLVVIALLFIIPMILSWLLVIILYIPGYIIDSIIVSYFYKRKK